MGLLLSASMVAARPKPLKAYLSGAKIAIVEGRPDEALLLLDSISMSYGMVPEALDLRSRVYFDKIEAASGVDAKRPFVEKLVAYIDTLKIACDSKDVDKKLRKDCDKMVTFADSTKVKFFREFYLAGRTQLKTIETLADDLANETDSTRRDYLEQDIQKNIDSVIANMDLVLMIDSTDFSPYVAIGDAYSKQGNYAKAVEWMVRGYDRAVDKTNLLQPLAFNYVQMEDYCSAIKYYKEWIAKNPDDVNVMFFLTICYNNCGLTRIDSLDYGGNADLDSAMMVYREILAKQPENTDVLAGAGRYFIREAQIASDSASAHRTSEDAAGAKQWDDQRTAMFDSAQTYFSQAFKLDTTDVTLAEQFGFTSALLGDCQNAVAGFEVVAAARPDDAGNWTSLGDCYLRLNDHKNALRAYEKVSELTPNKLQVWENLQALYHEAGQTQKEAAAAKKVKELSGK